MWVLRFGLLSVLAVAAGCSPSGPGANRPVPAYGGRSAELFDDTIEARAVGLDPEAASEARGDSLLRERVQIADAVVRVRVDTVTSKQEDVGPSYQIGFRVLEKLAGVNPPPDTFSVRVDRNSSSAGILRTYESQLVGKRFIAFVRLFARPDGERDYHFHIVPDTKEIAAAVSEATVLENFNK
jgi:hypothetical protein